MAIPKLCLLSDLELQTLLTIVLQVPYKIQSDIKLGNCRWSARPCCL